VYTRPAPADAADRRDGERVLRTPPLHRDHRPGRDDRTTPARCRRNTATTRPISLDPKGDHEASFQAQASRTWASSAESVQARPHRPPGPAHRRPYDLWIRPRRRVPEPEERSSMLQLAHAGRAEPSRAPRAAAKAKRPLISPGAASSARRLRSSFAGIRRARERAGLLDVHWQRARCRQDIRALGIAGSGRVPRRRRP